MREIDLILKRILARSRQIAKLRAENAEDREIIAEAEGRKPGGPAPRYDDVFFEGLKELNKG